MAITTCIFDAYGTLLDVNAAARLAAAEPGQTALATVWPALAADWRRKQLEYTWLRAVAGQHADFWQVTQDSLDWALEAARLTDPALRARLLALYFDLPAYPEVPALLTTVRARGLATGILSNGTPAMLDAACTSAGITDLLDAVLSVESRGIYKPHPSVYGLVTARFGCTPGQVMFISANGWDAAGAAAFGFHTVWINRTGAPTDRLYAQPQHIVTDLDALRGLI